MVAQNGDTFEIPTPDDVVLGRIGALAVVTGDIPRRPEPTFVAGWEPDSDFAPLMLSLQLKRRVFTKRCRYSTQKNCQWEQNEKNVQKCSGKTPDLWRSWSWRDVFGGVKCYRSVSIKGCIHWSNGMQEYRSCWSTRLRFVFRQQS